ncbi:AraC family transcriptional regulator [Bacillus pseudomycoides]|uniref:Helix-turn-helix domain-containing protein n=1 Tax=Bacillus pseudomycoides TaxID=64104 RepID=A0AAJ1Z3T1_9BACI|nr:effector binding domain-containing protein [Bacillus pseudomycoides]MDR4329445.1 helix-turn-helix domain-containing protein [Bacillus pseudomycoides]PEF22957.1 AraC family transcriptional regulator [Bacillus pseudomycoides]PEO49172.1 AraC family transcriptional regulator [Bacillus pseudomycoides]PFW93003.1 AraC family transcriptional regulator [Bacillus pseudomycoides]PFX41559.1 AraC family transcriptional regulator [Bacillus pseudomycoides]
MDYFEKIQNSIEFIESNLQDRLNVVEVSSQSCFSPFHFQRLFQAITGFSVQEYIRNRRLSEAAISLRETRKNILEIAIDFQYNSQEAFTRAFVNYFGMTPAKYRKSEIALHLQAKMNFFDYKKEMKGDLIMNKPNIVQLSKRDIIGFEYKTNLNNEKYFEEIPKFYFDFGSNEYYLRILEKIAPNMSYGIACNFHDDGNFSFIIGEEVQGSAAELDDGFVNFEIPEGKYAEFKVNGSTDLVQNTRRYIYGTWLPNSNYERREGPDFEITDVLQSIYPNQMKVIIYVPIL